MQAMEPYDRMGIYGQGVTGLISGYPGQYQSMSQPNPTALQTALGTASVLGGIYGNIGGGSTQGYQVGSPAYQASQMMMKQPAGYFSQGNQK